MIAFTPGEKVAMTTGSYRGWTAYVVSVAEDGRVTVRIPIQSGPRNRFDRRFTVRPDRLVRKAGAPT